jgi:hypothetical protein
VLFKQSRDRDDGAPAFPVSSNDGRFSGHRVPHGCRLTLQPESQRPQIGDKLALVDGPIALILRVTIGPRGIRRGDQGNHNRSTLQRLKGQTQ